MTPKKPSDQPNAQAKRVTVRVKSRDPVEPSRILKDVAKNFPNAEDVEIDCEEFVTSEDEQFERDYRVMIGKILERNNQLLDELAATPPLHDQTGTEPPASRTVTDKPRSVPRVWTIALWVKRYMSLGYRVAASFLGTSADSVTVGEAVQDAFTQDS